MKNVGCNDWGRLTRQRRTISSTNHDILFYYGHDNKLTRIDGRTWPEFDKQINYVYRGDGPREIRNVYLNTPFGGDITRSYYAGGMRPSNELHGTDTKTYIAGSFPGARETPAATVNDLWMIETQQLPADYLQGYLRGVKATSAQDVAKAAKRLIRPDELAVVVVGRAKDILADLEAVAPVTVVNAQTAAPKAPTEPEIN